MEPLPPALLHADRELHTLYERIPFSRYLNPINVAEARQAFRSGSKAPPLRYHAAHWADEELARLERLEPPLDHPLGRLIQTAIDGTTLFVRALRDRTPEAFDELARHSAWYPDEDTLIAARSERHDRDDQPFALGARDMISALRQGLVERGLGDWRVEEDPVMSARVLVDGAKRLLRVSPRASFRRRDIQRLVVHEVEVHAIRSFNGRRQPLKIFATGLPGSLETEEGLALCAEERSGSASPGTHWRQGVVVQAVEWARTMGFRELHEAISDTAGRGLAWGVAERLKRGLADPSAPGVYAKDIVYYRGHRKVKRWLDEGGDIRLLYVGKVGVDDPVQGWLDEGLVSLQPVPSTFR
jgi:hypothetical protein